MNTEESRATSWIRAIASDGGQRWSVYYMVTCRIPCCSEAVLLPKEKMPTKSGFGHPSRHVPSCDGQASLHSGVLSGPWCRKYYLRPRERPSTLGILTGDPEVPLAAEVTELWFRSRVRKGERNLPLC